MEKKTNISTTNTPFMPTLVVRQTEKKIGKTTFIIATSFNGDKKRSIGATLARIISRDVASGNDYPKISA